MVVKMFIKTLVDSGNEGFLGNDRGFLLSTLFSLLLSCMFMGISMLCKPAK